MKRGLHALHDCLSHTRLSVYLDVIAFGMKTPKNSHPHSHRVVFCLLRVPEWIRVIRVIRVIRWTVLGVPSMNLFFFAR